ncbi:secretogranin-1 [Hypanus sabinus]|uniref:secretogranin-1 n=1 Tax=Hypanus sabinus TaxID=79690 RepID=UPI0028C3D659|nr:secretogranin-1 [Hypanus sabinus]
MRSESPLQCGGKKTRFSSLQFVFPWDIFLFQDQSLCLFLFLFLAVVRALPAERAVQKDELVTRCIIEALSSAFSKQGASPVTSECKEILRSEKPETTEKKFEGRNNYYEDDKHTEDSGNPHYEDKGNQRAIEEYQRTHYEEDEPSEDESEEKRHYKQDHGEENTEVNNSEEDSRSIEDFYPVKNMYHVGSHGDHHSTQQHEERRYVGNISEQDNERRYRKHSKEDTTHEGKGSEKADSTESMINLSHHKRHEFRSEEDSSKEDKQFGIHGHSNERRFGHIDTGAKGSIEDLNNEDNRDGQYEHKKYDSEDLEEKSSEEGEKLHNDAIHYQVGKNYGHSDEDRNVHNDKEDLDMSDESSEDLEHIKNIHDYLKRNKNQVEFEDKANRHLMSSSEESKEEKHLNKKTKSEEKMYSEEEEKRHHTDYKRHHSGEEEEKYEKRYYSEEKLHNSEEKINNPNDNKQREESTEERYLSNGKDKEEERNTIQQFWWKKRHNLVDRNPGSEEEIKRSEHSHFHPEYEGHDDMKRRTNDDKRHEEDQGQNEGSIEENHIKQNLDNDFKNRRLYDRMDMLAHYLKSRKSSMENPKLYDSEEEKGKQHHNEGKEKMNHRVLTEEEQKDLENLAAMDLELEKIAEKMNGHQRN